MSPTDPTGGDGSFEARPAQLTFPGVGPSGDDLHPVTARAAALWAWGAHRAQGFTLVASTVDGLYDPAAPAGCRKLTAPAPLAQSLLIGRDEIEARPLTPGAGRFGKG